MEKKITTKETYMVKGLLEWRHLLRCGGALIPVEFTGGMMSGNGMVPGRFTTDNPVIQKLIKESKEFKDNLIVKC